MKVWIVVWSGGYEDPQVSSPIPDFDRAKTLAATWWATADKAEDSVILVSLDTESMKVGNPISYTERV